MHQGDDARNALQFTRSCPGVTTALVGMARAEHAQHDLALARAEPAAAQDLDQLLAAARA